MDYDLELRAVFRADPTSVFDAFLAVHGRDRPAWIVRSDLDLRVGGVWAVSFRWPGIAGFREVRVLSEVEPGSKLAYVMTAIYENGESFATQVEMSFGVDRDRTIVELSERGFPTEEFRDECGEIWASVMDVLYGSLTERGGGAAVPRPPDPVP